MRRVTASAVLALALALGACGGDDDGDGREISWFIAQQPGGALQELAQNCSEASNGRYRVVIETLPAQADAQREQLVRRLGAEDDSIDIVGMDVVWTGEFANAGWIEEVPQERRDALTDGIFDSVLDTAKYEDRLYAAPIWSNTQLLWYRKDRVDQAPETWDQMLEQAQRLAPNGDIQVQANRYEGLVVWATAMINSAGTSILSGPQEIALEREPTLRALSMMARVANSQAAPADIDTSNEGSAAIGFESGSSSFMINYPFVFNSAKSNAPEVFENMGAAKYPRVVPDIESAPPLGGFNLAVSRFSPDGDLAWDAVECLTSERNQLRVTELEGLPPVQEDLFDRQVVQDAYPGFASIVRDSIADATPRPSESPAYQDLSLAIQRALHPLTNVDPQSPTAAYERLRDRVEQAIEREGLL